MLLLKTFLTILFVMLIPIIAFSEDVDIENLKVKSTQDAWSIAQQYTGLSSMKNRSQTAMSSATNLIQVEEDKTPFLNKQIENNPVWEIKIGEAMQSEDFDSVDEERRKVPKGLTVWIDGATGQFLKAFTKYGKESPDLCPEPPADFATEELKRGEIWTGFLDTIPETSLMEALYHSPESRPHYAKELIIHLVVLENVITGETKPMWSIIARGVKGGGPTHGHVFHPCVDNRMRLLVDATTGKLNEICMGSPRLLAEDLK